MEFTIILSVLVVCTTSVTKHFIGHYTVPLVDPILMAYPIDMCVNYEVTIPQTALFGTYTCSNDQVTFTPYSDATCATIAGTTTLYTSTTATGELHSYSCSGQDSYVKIDSCSITAADTRPAIGDDGQDACCPTQKQANGDTAATCIHQTQATGVCLNQGNNVYIKTTCSNFTAVTTGYSANTCAEQSKLATGQDIITMSDIDECWYYDNKIIYDIYRRMRKCFEHGYDITADDDYCPFVSSNPTTSPTNNPHTATIDGDKTGSVMHYVVKNVFILVMCVAVYMLY